MYLQLILIKNTAAAAESTPNNNTRKETNDEHPDANVFQTWSVGFRNWIINEVMELVYCI